jgi:uncharacterized protein
MMKTIFRNRIVRFLVVPLVGLILLVLLGGGWYFSGVIEEDGLRVDNSPPELSVNVTAITADTITLKPLDGVEEEAALAFSAVWGITDGTNYGQLGDVVSESGESVTREYRQLAGQFDVGDDAYLDRSSFPHDPLIAHELEFTEVSIPGDSGEFGAWFIDDHSPRSDEGLWTILVHGRSSNRDTSLKVLNSLKGRSLTIDYRNDTNAPASESGFYDFGTTEWKDVEAAAQYALDNGAKKIVLVGYSMGGGIVVNYQLRSDLAQHTVGIILDSPMLNFGRTIDKGAEERGVPAPITFVAKLITQMRFGIDWDGLDFLARAGELTVPVLLIHGDADETVPVETSIEFAAAAPTLVEFHTYENVGHVAAWNWHPEEYENLFKDFVERVR